MTAVTAGILNIDKPAGMTSHDVVNRIRRLSHIRRVGHAGTLDPLATGVLLLCLGQATRLVEYLVGQPKTYQATIRLGQETNTYDTDGDIVAERPVDVDTADLLAALSQFRGEISQTPPMFSAIKKEGQPLYKLARQGVEIERPSRQVMIYALELLDWNAPDLEIEVVCSAGTYIRSIAHDLGQTLGCGGHITALRRTAVGTFSVAAAVSLDTLSPENLATYLQSADTAVSHLSRLDLSDEEAGKLKQGQRIPRTTGQPPDTLVRAYDANGDFIGVVTAESESWQARKMFHGSW